MSLVKKRVLFVGCFVKEKTDGMTGGQMFACNSLIESELGQLVDWTLIDTTGTIPIKPVHFRAAKAAVRLLNCIKHLLFSKIDTVLVFAADGGSFVEKGLLILIAKLMSKRTVIAPRSGYIVHDLAKKSMKRYIGRVFSKSDVVVCQSKHWENLFTEHFPGTKTVVVNNWIDADKYGANHVERWKSPTVKVLFLGWTTREKGVFELYEAVKNLSKKHDIHLTICGNGTAYDQLAESIVSDQLTDKIVLKGWVKHPEKMAQFRDNDIFVLPTHHEGFPNVLIEAMASKIPVVCSDIPEIASLVNDGEHCRLFRAGDAKGLEEQLEILLQTPPATRDKMVENAYQLVREKFSIESGVKGFQKIL